MSFDYNNNGKIDSDDFRYDDDGGNSGGGSCLSCLFSLICSAITMGAAALPALILNELIKEGLGMPEVIADFVSFIVLVALSQIGIQLIFAFIDWVRGK